MEIAFQGRGMGRQNGELGLEIQTVFLEGAAFMEFLSHCFS